ncbi:PREDICTED: transmembrane and TPR repeat-containing protein CG4050-like [Papilio xuthus]|uniref:dolichyl-phosphate-mannose--protein mannosyltransferase n=1 Tax=Papilio xuthus TaxID=66420 RepID=A0AAJ6ZM33_PAPXU|nr:PREDICTED: transmembrane and TPR repeat-containing protein CG4050-like [Papilio xuthus]
MDRVSGVCRFGGVVSAVRTRTGRSRRRLTGPVQTNEEMPEAPRRGLGAILVLACILVYHNSLYCGFVFDDISAIKENRDLRPQTPISNIFLNDFWGTPIHKEQSHKSYRPLTVLTFRWNYAVHGLQPAGYHLVNLLLHALVSLLYYRVCAMFLPEFASFVAAILFAVHPIHTEAVTGVVGRAEMLSSVFFLGALLCYARAASRRRYTDWRYLVACTGCVGIAMLCKEQGITVTAVCVVYELFVAQKRRGLVLNGRSWLEAWGKAGWGCGCGEAARRVATVCCATLALLAARLHVMGAQLPVFTRFDNPAGASPPPARHLTFAYLPALNAWLLTLPEALCCDWTMGTVALLRSWKDPRNLATVALATLLIAAAVHALRTRSSALSMGLALLVLPFLPASNLFFPVGFVVAERVLYMPSMGWCLLVAHGWRLLARRRASLAAAALIFLLLAFSAKTYVRNWDWKTEYSIFASGLKVNRNNAKLYNNVGHALEADGKYAEALQFFNTAVSVQPDDVGAHINVGRTYNHLGRYQEAEEAYVKAKSLLPKAKPGESYQARIAPNHLNVFLNLANLISKNVTRLEEADMLYRQAISMRADYTQAYINRGDILIKLNRTKEAQEVYERALLYDSGNPDIYYNLGVVLLEQGKASQALAYLDKALELEPEHEQALLNSAILLQELGAADLRHLARQRLLKLLDKDATNERVHFNLGMVCMDEGDAACAERWFRAAVRLKPDFRSALFNLALLLADRRRPLEAAPFLKQLVRHHPDHVKALVLLGDIYINSVKDLDAAESCYRRILELEPDNVQALHNLCVVAVERGKLAVAEECLSRAAALAPHEHYIQRHLAVVRTRRAALASPTPHASHTPHTPHTPSSASEVRARWNYIPQQPPDPHETDPS